MKDADGNYAELLGSKASLFDLGRSWRVSSLRPYPSKEQIIFWDELVREWANKPDIPLFVRNYSKSNNNRGSITYGFSGREFITVDNSPAQWLYVMACDDHKILLNEILVLLKTGKIPVAMILPAEEKRKAVYCGSLGKTLNTQKLGWKLAHIDQIGEGLSKIKISTSKESFLEDHFKKFMSPSNMFVIPKEYAYLAENKLFLEGFISEEDDSSLIVDDGNNLIDEITRSDFLPIQKPIKKFILFGALCGKNEFEKYLIHNNMNGRMCTVYIKIIYHDDSHANKVWHVGGFRPGTDLNGNLNSGYLRHWRKKGIKEIELKIS